MIADGQDVRDLVPADSRIRLIHLIDVVPIGDKRNFGCELAAGQIIAHWDDDDYSAPSRLGDQIDRMAQSGKAVTGYCSMRFTDAAASRWWLYKGERNYALGTSLCYRREWWAGNQFPSLQVGEDNQFVAQAWASEQLASVDAGEMMHATVHAGNTSPRNMAGGWTEL